MIAEPECEEKQQKKEELKIKCASITSLDENLRKHYIVPCLNSFEEFSHIATSIYYCSPPDHLHVFLLGLLKSAAEATIGIWTNSNKNKLDLLARTILGQNSSTVRDQFPRYPMDRGLSNLSLVSGTEWSGFWFAILVIGRTNVGSLFLTSF